MSKVNGNFPPVPAAAFTFESRPCASPDASSDERYIETFGSVQTTAYTRAPLPLKSRCIRLLALQRSEDGNVSGTLTVHSLDDRSIQWIALSYTWQSVVTNPHRDRRHTILVNDRPLTIQENLWQALNSILDQRQQAARGWHNYRQQRTLAADFDETCARDDLPIWIDALCIDQSLIIERNHQVTLMKDIFSRARRVVAWLTPDPALPSPRPAQVKRALFDHFNHDRRCRACSMSPGGFDQERLPPEVGKLHINAISRNPYWERMWILQERLLTSRVTILYEGVWMDLDHCPREKLLPIQGHEVSLDRSDSLRTVLEVEAFPSMGLPYVAQQQQSSSTNADMKPGLLIAYIYCYRDHKCSDPRDRVYALLGLLPESYPIRPNYSISLVRLLLEVSCAEAVHLFRPESTRRIDLTRHDWIDWQLGSYDRWAQERMLEVKKSFEHRSGRPLGFSDMYPEYHWIHNDLRYVVDALEIGSDNLIAQGIVAFYTTASTVGDLESTDELTSAQCFFSDVELPTVEKMVLGIKRKTWIPRTKKDVIQWLLGTSKGRAQLDLLLFTGFGVEEGDKVRFLRGFSKLWSKADYSIKIIRRALEGHILQSALVQSMREANIRDRDDAHHPPDQASTSGQYQENDGITNLSDSSVITTFRPAGLHLCIYYGHSEWALQPRRLP